MTAEKRKNRFQKLTHEQRLDARLGEAQSQIAALEASLAAGTKPWTDAMARREADWVLAENQRRAAQAALATCERQFDDVCNLIEGLV